MPNNQYRKGRNFEYRVKQDYEKQGYTVVRSSGSHGAYDLVCLHPSGQTLLIQCKAVKRKAHVKQLIREVEATMLFSPKAYTQILAVKVKGDSDYTKIYLGQET